MVEALFLGRKMTTRRTFLAAAGAGLAVAQAASSGQSVATKCKRLAVVTTEWRFHSHAWHMADRFLVGYPIGGRWHRPPIDVVSAYFDQKPLLGNGAGPYRGPAPRDSL